MRPSCWSTPYIWAYFSQIREVNIYITYLRVVRMQRGWVLISARGEALNETQLLIRNDVFLFYMLIRLDTGSRRRLSTRKGRKYVETHFCGDYQRSKEWFEIHMKIFKNVRLFLWHAITAFPLWQLLKAEVELEQIIFPLVLFFKRFN